MNCPECDEVLQERLDGREPADRAALDRHLAGCPDCRDRHAAVQRLADGLRLLAFPAPPAGLAGRIADRVLAEQRSRGQFRRRLTFAAAVAAGLLAVVAAGYQAYRAGWFGDRPDDSPLVKRPGGPEKKAPVKDEDWVPHPRPAPSLGETLEEAGSAAVDLARRQAQETVSQARRLLTPTSPLKVPLKGGDTLAALDPPAQSLRQAGKSLSAGLQPVTTSARRAVNWLLRETPGMDADPNSGF